VRIVYFTESLFPLVDGVSRTLGQLFDHLERRNVEFRIVAPFRPEGVSWADRVWAAPYVRFPWYPDYRISYPRPGTSSRLKEFAPDLVHLVSPTPMAVWAQRWAKRSRIPSVASFHTHFVSYLRYYRLPALEPVGWRLLGRFYRRCERVYAPTRRIIEELKLHGISNTELWSRGIDLRRFGPAFRNPALRASVAADEQVPILLLVSRLVREKDLLDLIPMTRILERRGISFRLVIVGDGPLRGELEQALPDAVFVGHREGEELSQWYASSDLFVFPSTTETFGNVVAEAQASGLPTIVVDRGGPPELVSDGATGFVVPPNDPKALADRTALLLQDPETRMRMGAAARRSASHRDWEVINDRLLLGYRQVVEESGAGRGS
jgi:phosphatidylinositol alpha 1,6-mannosyltransferase